MIMFICATLMLFIMVICVFIANAKTSRAPDSMLRCLRLRRRVRRRRTSRVDDAKEQLTTDWRIDWPTAVLKSLTQVKLYSLTPPLYTHTQIGLTWEQRWGYTTGWTAQTVQSKASCVAPNPAPPPNSSRLSVIRVCLLVQSQPGSVDVQ